VQVLIVGAGIAGLTLAGLLRRFGIEPVIIERAPDFTHTGYMLGLYPLGGRVLHALGLHDRYVAESQATKTYSLWNSRGRHVKDYSFEQFIARFGPYQMLSRGELLQLLLSASGGADAVRTGTTLTKINQTEDRVRATFSDGAEHDFDLVVAADGMFSAVRDLVFGSTLPRRTGWGGWIWWTDADIGPHDTVSEYWTAGAFAGIYPTRDSAGLFIGGPNAQLQQAGTDGIAAFVQRHFAHAQGPIANALTCDVPDSECFYWELLDVRAREWVKGRVVLLGDAAAGFLPTAGVGASMAMESAAALADELSRTDAAYVPNALKLFEKRRRKRVEAVQSNSRSLARLMFTSNGLFARTRDVVMRFYTMEQALKPIVDAMSAPI
jgi:2-polyprenyl-6-methoxyphenol hydroxylase-like FAD-dependent oxidoreductase